MPFSRLPRMRSWIVTGALGVSAWWIFVEWPLDGPVNAGSAASAEPAGVAADGTVEPREASATVDPGALLERGAALLEENRPEEARAVLERALDAAPGHPDVQHRLGLALVELDEAERAQELLEAAVETRPNDAEIVFALAQAVGYRAATSGNPFTQLSLGSRSKDLLDRAVELDPELVDARLARMLFYVLAPSLLGGGLEKARAEAEAILKVDEVAGLFARGWVAEEDEDWEEAERLHRLAILLDPSYVRARLRLGYLLLGQERHAEAREQFRACVELGPREPRPHEGLGRSLLGLGDAEGAAASHERALELAPDLAPAVLGLAEARAELGDVPAARALFRRFLDLDRRSDEGTDRAHAWLAAHPD